jgi:hypothetical protein
VRRHVPFVCCGNVPPAASAGGAMTVASNILS